ncbi:hypothetical protein GPECTOR_22g937 [Gonium pectorale]|uniref:Uncharacterized protein n=1 Tax=Gonium pectorale TaxID=33097 RepID=A0A150GHT1_GONPE|nr:hypothetical protein GPECTOR_22g937 [Gonium pectorale]|eukprot:KXZ49343.1 hypothetical protein GPECTOR_22g937 [Gonium pectorale]
MGVCEGAAGVPAGFPDAGTRLEWLLGRGYTVDESAVHSAISAGNAAALELLLRRGLRPRQKTKLVAQAAGAGRLEVLRVLQEHAGPLNGAVAAVEAAGAWVAMYASAHGGLPVLAWAAEELGASVQSAGLMDLAAESGSLEKMAWLREQGCPWGGDTFKLAALGGCEAALEWLAEQGCPMPADGSPYRAAAGNNDFATLRCLARLGCPWGPASGPDAVFASCTRPGRPGPLPVLRLLVQLGCPVDWEAARQQAESLPADVREWLLAEAETEAEAGAAAWQGAPSSGAAAAAEAEAARRQQQQQPGAEMRRWLALETAGGTLVGLLLGALSCVWRMLWRAMSGRRGVVSDLRM